MPVRIKRIPARDFAVGQTRNRAWGIASSTLDTSHSG